MKNDYVFAKIKLKKKSNSEKNINEKLLYIR